MTQLRSIDESKGNESTCKDVNDMLLKLSLGKIARCGGLAKSLNYVNSDVSDGKDCVMPTSPSPLKKKNTFKKTNSLRTKVLIYNALSSAGTTNEEVEVSECKPTVGNATISDDKGTVVDQGMYVEKGMQTSGEQVGDMESKEYSSYIPADQLVPVSCEIPLAKIRNLSKKTNFSDKFSANESKNILSQRKRKIDSADSEAVKTKRVCKAICIDDCLQPLSCKLYPSCYFSV
eukprot:Nk52_evm15s164 gene=Nk52_evmTU15s164